MALLARKWGLGGPHIPQTLVTGWFLFRAKLVLIKAPGIPLCCFDRKYFKPRFTENMESGFMTTLVSCGLNLGNFCELFGDRPVLERTNLALGVVRARGHQGCLRKSARNSGFLWLLGRSCLLFWLLQGSSPAMHFQGSPRLAQTMGVGR